MTAGHDGMPDNDDPFAYLYRSEGGEQPDPAGGQTRPGPPQPRTSYHQVQRVGERRSPQPPAAGGYGYPPQQRGNGGYGQQPYGGPDATQQYAYQPPDAPPPGGRRAGQQGGGPDAPNRKGLLIGAIAVVAAVAVGIAFAMTNSSGDKKNQGDGKPTPSAASTTPSATQTTPSASPTQFVSQKVDAATLTLAGGAQQSTQWPGANAAGGTYVDHMGTVGASVLWTVTVPTDGKYTFFISYGNAGDDAKLGLAVNGKPRAKLVNLNNWGHATDWSKAWNSTTFAWVNLKSGANTLLLSCMPAVNCGVNLDQVWLKQGEVTK